MTSVFMMLYFLFGYGQELPNVVPPSPEASELAKFTEIPVSHYTGLPNISVPIYTIKQKGITIPISLSYHARGVQVAQVASRTGLGWSLTYGGSISRQTRGMADELGYLSPGNRLKAYSDSLNVRQSIYSGTSSGALNFDFYPDQFTFNAGGVSGKFIFDYNDLENPLIQSYGDVKITYTRDGSVANTGRIDSFQITDSQGNIYYFGKSKDGTRLGLDYQDSNGLTISVNGNVNLDSPHASSSQIYSAWKLMDVETVYGELISYFYESENNVYYRKVMDRHSHDPDVANSLENLNNLNAISTKLSKVWNYENQLTKIEFNQGRDRIVFKKSSNLRQDYPGHSLDEISLYHKEELVKSFKLNYTYTESNDRSNMLSYVADYDPTMTMSFKRMFLASVEEVKGQQKLPPHEFTYDPQVLPATFSTRQDYWGYYNGAENNGPFNRLFRYGNYEPNRRVDTLKSEAGILKEIKYPTGGISKFTYEHNRGMAPLYARTLVLPKINPGTLTERKVVLTKNNFYHDGFSFYKSVNVEIPERTKITIKPSCLHLRHVDDPADLPDCLFKFSYNGNYINIGEESTFWTSSRDYSGSITIGLEVLRDHNNWQELYKDPRFDFQLEISYDLPDDLDNLYGAGKRIKKIEHINENGTVSTKEYDYRFSLDTNLGASGGRPSGAIIGFPSFINTPNSEYDSQYANMTKYFDATSAYSSYQPNAIGYSGVVEYIGTKGQNIGKTEYTYTNLDDTGGDYWEFPYHPPTDNEWLRGKPVRVKQFKRLENGNFQLIKETYYKYIYGNNIYEADFEIPGLRHLDFVFTPIGSDQGWETNTNSSYERNRNYFRLPLYMLKRTPPSYFNDPSNPAYAGYRIYHLTGGTMNLHSTTETNYFDSGNQVTTTENFYNYYKHYQLSKTKQTLSSGKVILGETIYPQDLEVADRTSAERRLVEANRFVPIDTFTFQDNNSNSVKDDGELLTHQKTNYKDNSADNSWPNIVLPNTIKTAKGTQPLEDRVVYHAYDAKGNPTEVSKKDGTHIVYIWGYNDTQPVAKIENARLTDIPSSLKTEIQNNSNSDSDIISENTLRTSLNKLRNPQLAPNLVNAQIITYTYDPLIGVTSITDPRGKTMYYDYDDFNRLRFIKDSDGNILKEHKYNYKNQ